MLSRCGMMGLALVAVLLVSTAAADLPTIGFAVKGGAHWVEDPRATGRAVELCWELEIESPAFWGGHVTLVGGFNGTNLDNERDRQTWSEGDVSYDRRERFEYGLNGGRLGVRPWPGADVDAKVRKIRSST